MPHIAACRRNQHAQRKKLKCRIGDFGTVGLHVEIVAPPADSLRQQQPRHDHIHKFEEGQLLSAGVSPCPQRAADHSPVNGDAAFPDIENRNGVVAKELPRHGDIIEPRADDAAGDYDQRQVDHRVARQAQPSLLTSGQPDGHKNPRHDQNAVPLQRAQKGPAVRNRHAHYLSLPQPSPLAHFRLRLLKAPICHPTNAISDRPLIAAPAISPCGTKRSSTVCAPGSRSTAKNCP